MNGALLLADSDTGKGSPIGLLVVLLLVVAVYFLWRSMNRHLKKVEPPAEEAYEAQFRSAKPADPPAPVDEIENGPPPAG